jgi:23S rRNA pseudouridine2605 synthase
VKSVLKTLERVLSKAGLGSRTDARSWIHARRVKVNGRVIENPEHWVDFERDRVELDGRRVEPLTRLYILLYKPTGYITSKGDPEGRPTVYDLLKDVPTFVGTVGRLDEDTSGLLLFTNDTQLAERLTNPAHHMPKTYRVKCATLLSDQQLEQLRQGIELNDGPTRPARVERLRDSATHTFLELTITEGRNRQVRRMIEALDSKVLKLVRTRLGDLTLDGVSSGRWRHLSAAEVRALKTQAGLCDTKHNEALRDPSVRGHTRSGRGPATYTAERKKSSRGRSGRGSGRPPVV